MLFQRKYFLSDKCASNNLCTTTTVDVDYNIFCFVYEFVSNKFMIA